MSVKTILRELSRRNASLCWQDGKLWVSPKSALDDVLRGQMRQHRAELEQVAQDSAKPIVEAAIDIFGGEIVATIDVLADVQAGHIPATVQPSCRTVGGTCKAYSVAQINAMTQKQLATHTKNCGDCDLIQTDLKLVRLKAKREKREENERRQDYRNNRFVVGTEQSDDETE